MTPREELEALRRLKELTDKANGNLDYNKLTYAPTVGMSTGERAIAGFGSAVPRIVRGAAQTLGLGDQQDIADAGALDKPLLNTTAGKVGNAAGNVNAFLPFSMLPGANTIPGAAVLGTGMGLTEPVEQGSVLLGKVKNAALGGLFGGGTQAVLGGGASLAKNNVRQLADQQAQNVVKDATIANARNAGYVVPPVQTNPSILNRVLEGFAGKLSTGQSASIKNQNVTNDLVRSELGLSKNTPLTRAELASIRGQAGTSYDALKNSGLVTADRGFYNDLNQIAQTHQGAAKDFPGAVKDEITPIVDSLKMPQFDASSAVDMVKVLRGEADKAYTSGDKALGSANKKAAGAIEDLLDRHLQTNAPGLLGDYRAARTLIAKTYSVEKALNPATGNVNANALAAQLKRNKPLSGGLQTAAEFASGFPKAADEVMSSMPGVSPLDYATAGGLGAVTGNPSWLAAIAGRPAVRAGILSGPYQRTMGAPNYRPGLFTNFLTGAEDPYAQALGRIVPGSIFR